MNLKFLEIGTSNFRTLIETATDDTFGMSVEPLSDYLNQLPSPHNVIKVNAAISFNNSEDDIEIFYVPESTIKEKELPDWLKGCNCLFDYHPKHKELNVEKFVKIEKVKQIPIAKLLKDYNIEEIETLKIDTEGGDCYILKNLYSYIETKDIKFYPKKIIFETNNLTDSILIKETIDLYLSLGYQLGKKKKQDTILIYNNGKTK